MAQQYDQFIKWIHQKLGIDLSLYKEAQMKRRILSLRNKKGYKDFQSYFYALEKDEQLLNEFVDRLTINVSEFFRNPQRWSILKEKIIPELLKTSNRLSIWSAACSTGEEPYTLAMILKEHFPHVRFNILATDIDEAILNKARKGVYQKQSLKELPNHYQNKYFDNDENLFYIKEEMKKDITFKRHNLLADPFPSQMDLIICRNVLIYFTDKAKIDIYHKISSSLREDGILFVGSTEQIFTPEEYNLSLYDTFFYQKMKE